MQLNGVEPISILRAAKRVQMNTQAAQSPWTLVRKQGLLTLAGCILVGVGWGIDPAISVAVGGLCVALPSAHFAWASERTLVGSRILSQGVVKVVSTGVLMASFLGFGAVQAPWFLLGMLAGQAAYVWTLAEASWTDVMAEPYVGTERYVETAAKTAPVVENQRDGQD